MISRQLLTTSPGTFDSASKTKIYQIIGGIMRKYRFTEIICTIQFGKSGSRIMFLI